MGQYNMKHLLLLLFFLWGLSAQSAVVDIKAIDVDEITLNDLDFLGRGTTKTLFEIGARVDAGINAYLCINVEKDGKTFATLKTKVLKNPNGFDNTGQPFTNADVGRGIFIQDNKGDQLEIKIKTAEIDESLIGSSSVRTSLPSGKYKFVARVYKENTSGGNFLHEDIISFHLESNRQIELLSPFDGSSITSVPRFEWSTQHETIRKFIFQLHEALPGGGTNLDGKQIIRAVLANNVFELDLNSANNVPYKNLLIKGKQYVWTVSGTYKTTSGEEVFDSSLSKFTYGTESQARNSALDGVLQQLVGSNYETIKKAFDGMSSEEIRLNGKTIDIKEFQRYINQLDLVNKRVIVEYN